MIASQDRALKRMQTARLKPIYQILDNEASAKYKKAITQSGLTYQLVRLNDHRWNIAKNFIQL